MITNFIRFINENNNLENTNLKNALSILDETEIPEIFQNHLNINNFSIESKIDLIKYVAEQAQGLHDLENKKVLYKSSCRLFTKKLTDAAIEAFPL